jgi:hypothetical protein
MDSDGLTPEERLKIFDRLPKAIRIVLAAAPYNFDVNDIRNAWDGMRQDGWTPTRAARKIARDAAKMAAQAQWKKERDHGQPRDAG